MERKIGEIIEFDDAELKVVEITKEERQANESCAGCYFFHEDTRECSEFKEDAYAERQLGSCYENKRTDKKSVKFINVRRGEVSNRKTMKKISFWEDLIGVELTTTRGLSANVTDEGDCYTAKIYHGNEIEPIIVIDWAFDLERMTQIMYKFGFDIEYEEPFNLVEFLKENIEPKKFEINKENYSFTIHKDIINIKFESINETLGTFYFRVITSLYDVDNILFEKEVTASQLKTALKELRWL